MAKVIMNNVPLVMEVDSGSACSLISEAKYHNLWPAEPPPMMQVTGVLKQWSQSQLQVLGKIQVQVEFRVF